MADEPGRFDHWGVGPLHTFPNEGSASGTVVFQPGDIVILPYCRYVQDRCGSKFAKATSPASTADWTLR